MGRSLLVTTAIVVGTLAFFWHRHVTQELPTHAEPRPNVGLHGIWSEESLDRMMDMIKDYARDHIPSAVRDFTYKHEHVGELTPFLEDGTCPHGYLVPNKARTGCVFPGRLDIGHHYIVSGGYAGFRETYDKLVSRMISFNLFLFTEDETLTKMPEFSTLFDSPGYKEAAQKVCQLDAEDPVLEPFQLAIIIQTPGMQVPTHYDAPWFKRGMDRFHLPIWLLVAMQWSGLWKDDAIHQLQGVAYLHTWTDTDANGGGFFYFPNGPGGPSYVFDAKRNNALMLDGSEQVHGTTPFRGDADVPMLDRNADLKLIYHENDTWFVHENGEPVIEYTTDDLRITFVWRSLCFHDQDELDAWKASDEEPDVEEIMATFIQDLRKRGKLSDNDDDLPSRFDLGVMILNEYVLYPFSANRPLMPYNYCALPQAFKQGTMMHSVAESFVNMVC